MYQQVMRTMNYVCQERVKQNTQEVKNERFLIRTRQNTVPNFGQFCLRQSDERTNRYIKHEFCKHFEQNDDGMVHGRRDEQKIAVRRLQQNRKQR